MFKYIRVTYAIFTTSEACDFFRGNPRSSLNTPLILSFKGFAFSTLINTQG